MNEWMVDVSRANKIITLPNRNTECYVESDGYVVIRLILCSTSGSLLGGNFIL